MSSPLITLITDFGLEDHYTGTMKGVILSGCPEARLVDITHQVPPFSIHAGAYQLAQAAPFFPPGTIHVVVVDPGVGSERRAILVEAHEQLFIAPDNGVLTLAVEHDEKRVVRELRNPALWRPVPSATFHGRDIFAPAAAALASGKASASDTGPVLTGMILLPDLCATPADAHTWQGIVLSVDHFGNVVTNFRAVEFLARLTNGFLLAAGSAEISTFRTTFSDAAANEIFVYAGSSGYLEIGMNQGPAARRLGILTGDRIRLTFVH